MLTESKNIFFFGDSITYGQLVSVNKTWVYKVANWLDMNIKYPPTIVQNSSIMGNTTRDALNRIYNDVLFRNPSIVYVQFGMNDCNHWQTENGLCRVQPDTFTSNLHEIVSRSISYGARVIVGTNHSSNKDTQYDQRNAAYNQLIRNFCSGHNVTLVDHELECKKFDVQDIVLPDGIHLSEMGHDVYFENFIKTIYG
jgi:lysophospholipase L1-like esterase